MPHQLFVTSFADMISSIDLVGSIVPQGGGLVPNFGSAFVSDFVLGISSNP